MAAKKVKLPQPDGSEAEGVEVYPKESTERWSEFSLDDGTQLRLKMVVGKFIRMTDQFDAEGNPVYAVNGAPNITFTYVPTGLKRKVG